MIEINPGSANAQTSEIDYKDPIYSSIPYIEAPISYSQFFHLFLLPNRPCVLGGWATKHWACSEDWKVHHLKSSISYSWYFRKARVHNIFYLLLGLMLESQWLIVVIGIFIGNTWCTGSTLSTLYSVQGVQRVPEVHGVHEGPGY